MSLIGPGWPRDVECPNVLEGSVLADRRACFVLTPGDSGCLGVLNVVVNTYPATRLGSISADGYDGRHKGGSAFHACQLPRYDGYTYLHST